MPLEGHNQLILNVNERLIFLPFERFLFDINGWWEKLIASLTPASLVYWHVQCKI